MEKLVIVGTGCAGLTAAVYAARGNLRPVVLEGRQPGGQLSTTTLVENFPGFPEGIDGPELITRMKTQAEGFGARFRYVGADRLSSRKNGYISLTSDDEETVETRTLIVASGAAARWLELPREKELIGHGLTSCATCDGAFYRNVPICVVGGGDSAAEEALFLTRFASKVYLIHRRDALRASAIMTARVLDHPKIEPIWNTVVAEYLTDDEGEMRAIRLQDTQGGADRKLEVKCVFVAIGHEPNTKPFAGKLDVDEEGYLLKTHGTATERARRVRGGRRVRQGVPAGDLGGGRRLRGGTRRRTLPHRIQRGTRRVSARPCLRAAAPAERPRRGHLKICDLTQFYSPVSGGVKRYLAEKTAYLRARTDDRHVLVIPGERNDLRDDGPSRVYTIRSPLMSRTSQYRRAHQPGGRRAHPRSRATRHHRVRRPLPDRLEGAGLGRGVGHPGGGILPFALSGSVLSQHG